MFTTVFDRELRGILVSQKFTITFGVVALLILMSMAIGIQEYHAGAQQYATAVQLTEQQFREASTWMGLGNRALRPPDPLMAFVSGVHNDIGRLSSISGMAPVKLFHSVYSDDPIFAVFRSFDFAFLVQIVLSLMAILFTYDAISGERESGTLQLSMANPVPRRTYLLAKAAGIWSGLLFSLSVPIAFGILIVALSGVPLLAEDWIRVGLLLAVSLLFFTVWVVLGIAISAWTRNSSISFMVCLVVWVATVLILPRIGVMVAEQFIPVPTVAEADAQRDGYAKDAWDKHMRSLTERWRAREAEISGLSNEAREAYREDHMWSWMETDEADRKAVQSDIDAYGVRLQEDLRNRRATQEHLALFLARFSPAASYQLAAMEIARTDIGIKNLNEEAMERYRGEFKEYVDRKQKESGDTGGFRITVDSKKGFSFSAPRERGTLDISDLPRFVPVHTSIGEILQNSLVDACVLILFGLLALGGAVLGFHRYDVR
jgi:ABC-type transport system involved in multi-copper enzyme maturation permease subunit